MEKIKSISEAFSSQPTILFVQTEENAKSYYDKPRAIKEIKLDTITIGHECGDPIERLMYVGYNFDGQKLFQYLATTVNVTYETNINQ